MHGSRSSRRRTVAVLALAVLVAGACRGGDDAPVPGTDAAPGADGTTDGGDPAADSVVFEEGVTAEPCPNAVDDDNGCIYLGVLSDLTEGPFAALAVPVTEGQRAFWQRVNEQGGIGGFEVDIDTYTRDNRYDVDAQNAEYRDIEPEILALAQSFGTPQTEAILSVMDDDEVVAVPAGWWSGWDFGEADRGLVLGSGYSYCLEALVGLDWLSSEYGEPASVMAVGYAGDHGNDVAAGGEAWAEANGADWLGFVETAPNAVIGTQDTAIEQVVGSEAGVVLLAVSPAEAADIVGGAAANGFEGRFVGSAPSWNPAVLQTDAADALVELYTLVTPWERFEAGASDAHEAMRASLDGELPTNDGFTAGWIWSYPLKAALEAAVANGDLTREGLRAVVDGLEVDYEGALPPRTYGGDPNENAVRSAVISRPDPAGAQGLETLAGGVTGPTADAYDYSRPCSG